MINKLKTILITGATGFIGSWLTRYFLNKEFNIIAHGSSKNTILNLKQKLEQQGYSLKNLEFWEQNFKAQQGEFPNFQNIDFLIHCAALTSVRKGIRENYDKYFTVNVLGTKILAEKALDNNISHFIHLSSGQIYGKPKRFPINDKTPKEPINLYGFTKLMSEEVVKAFGIFGLNYTIMRPFSVYGKEQSNIISIIINKIKNDEILTIYGDGTQTRAFMHINDICNAIRLVLGNHSCFNEEFNLSGLKEYSVNKLVEMIAQKLGKEPKIEYKDSGINELKRNLADTTKLQKIGFQYEYSLENFIETLD
jgi:nucleoside-diphosphate-sugar epimerase